MTTTINERPNLGHLKTAKIHFKNGKDQEKGFYILMVSGMPLQALPDDRYVINQSQIRLLEEKGIEYELD